MIILASMVAMAFMPFTASAASKPGKVNGVKVINKTAYYVTIQWKKAKHATAYGIYVKNKKLSSKFRLAEVTTDNTCTISKYIWRNNKHYIKVKAYKKAGKKKIWGKDSGVRSVTTLAKCQGIDDIKAELVCGHEWKSDNALAPNIYFKSPTMVNYMSADQGYTIEDNNGSLSICINGTSYDFTFNEGAHNHLGTSFAFNTVTYTK